MTYIPTNQGSGPVSANVDSTNANFGATNFPSSPNTDGDTSTEIYLLDLNNANIGTTP